MNTTRAFVTVVLLFSLATCRASSDPEPAGRAAKAHIIDKETTQKVDVVAFRQGPDGPEGITSSAKVILKPNPSREVRVAVYEEYSGGTGAQWRASVWMASFLASMTQNVRMTDYEFAVSAGGFIDGPSAGALITGATVATLAGAHVREDVTMTGTINPDGTVGPVGGIPHKMRAAAKAGKKIFGFPLGQRYAEDLKAERLIDLHELAKELGIEAKEVADIGEAFTLLTGRKLGTVEPVATSDMEIAPESFKRMQAQTSAWLAQAQSSIAVVRQTRSVGAKVLAQTLAPNVAKTFDEAVRYQAQGLAPMAYTKALQCAAFALTMQDAIKLFDLGLAGDLDGVLLEVKAQSSVSAELDSLIASIETRSPDTVDNVFALIDGYNAAAYAWSSIQLAQRGVASLAIELKRQAPSLRQRDKLAAFIFQQGLEPLLYFRIAKLYIAVGRDRLDDGNSSGARIQLDARELDQLARAYTSAAKANLDYYDALVLQAQADRAGASLAQAQAVKAEDDSTYLFAQRLLGFALSARDEHTIHASLKKLASATTAYVSGAELIAADYSLGAQKKGGTVVAVSRDKALIAMLEIAERKARETAAMARTKIGLIPGRARIDYQLARAQREEGVDEKLNALNSYWTASIYSQLAVQMQRTSTENK